MVLLTMKVLLLDDHPLMLDALTHVLHVLDERTEVIAAETPAQAFEALDGPDGVDLLLLDLKLGEPADGFEVLARVRQTHPHVAVTVVSGTERLADVVRAVDMGAVGFIPKRTPREETFRALAMVTSGGVYLPQAMLDLIARLQDRQSLGETTIGAALAQLSAADLAATQGGGAPASVVASEATAPSTPSATLAQPTAPGLDSLSLTPRQTEVLKLLLKALPNKLIARELNLSVETVKDHVAAVLRALGVSSRTQAVLAVARLTAQDAKVAQPPPPSPPGA